ncbi:ABC transporter substrate-binding protein [uncultured Amnibacterium sp.]|uniref:ABC transporter substrate-binding protein n=1 Tax=uncultured Amnibacterium sp. TaxID=1631851 RepID=UPI0035CBB404
MNNEVSNAFSRRNVLGLAALAAAVPLLAACSPGGAGGGSSAALKFWDMPWGADAFLAAEKALVATYKPAKGLPAAKYQLIQWDNFYQTFSAAVASKTGPAVSSGGGFQAFQLADQGAIAYADKVVDAMKKNGMYDDFIPGLIDSFKTDKGYVAIPWSIDIRVLWYQKSVLEKAGAEVPTDWDSLRAAGLALKKIGAYGFGTGAGSGNGIGNQSVMTMILNNGGGLFDEAGKPNTVTPANVEAVDFLLGLAKDGIIDPNSISYTSDNMLAQWKNKKFGIGVSNPGLATDTGSTDGDLLVMSPLTSASGKKGTIVYIPNLMMYTNTPSQEGSEAFLLWYLQNIKKYWAAGVAPLLPAFNSIAALPEFQKDTQGVKIIKEWAPIAKTLAANSPKQFAALAALDGGSAINQFAQTVLAGKGTATAALKTLETGLNAVVK